MCVEDSSETRDKEWDPTTVKKVHILDIISFGLQNLTFPDIIPTVHESALIANDVLKPCIVITWCWPQNMNTYSNTVQTQIHKHKHKY